MSAHLRSLVEAGRPALAHQLIQAVVNGIDQALDGVLARHGQLIVLSLDAREALVALKLSERWAVL
jgi:hypothetical protein